MEKPEILLFYKTSSPFSQFHHANYIYNGISFCCAEQGMMYEKAKLFGDIETANSILTMRNPKNIKALGRKVKNFDDKMWNDKKKSIVYAHNVEKFRQNKHLKDALLETGKKILAEASPYDRVWGIGLASSDERAMNPFLWQGSNLLGKILMDVRAYLREDQYSDHDFVI